MPKIIIEIDIENMILAKIVEKTLALQFKGLKEQQPAIQEIKTRVEP